jgi:outer membrane receptor protein involved in Fe transport
MMKYSLSLVFLLLTAACFDAAGGSIRGRVYDITTFEALPSATIIYGRGKGTVADSDGYYTISEASGEMNLSFRFVGYRPVVHTVFIGPGDTIVLDVGMEYDIAEIDQIIVSAGKIEQRLSELTVSVNIIKPGILSTQHISDPVEMINKTSGVEVIDGQASIRGGSGFSYGAGSRVLALIDGLPVLSADAGHIKWQFLPLENISQVEIIKGASSVLYGSSALNGVINFRTAEAGSEPVTRFYIESGMFGNPANRNWIWWDSPRTFQSTSFSHTRKAGSTDLSVAMHLLNNDGYRRLNDERLGRMNLRVRHDDNRIKGLTYGINVNAGLTRATNFILWEDAWTGALKQDESTAKPLDGSLITLDPFVSLNNNDRLRHYVRTRVQFSENRYPAATQDNSRAHSFLGEYQLIYMPATAVGLNFGLFENYSTISSPFYGDHNALNLAGYLQADITPSERLKIVSGVRIEHNSLDGTSDGFMPLFRAGINYRLLDYTFLRASYGQGYRYPSIAEKHAATTRGSVRIVPNPLIRAESGWSSELGLKQGIITGIVNGQVDIAFFYSRNTDMIEYLFGIYPESGGGSFSPGFMAFNVEHSRVYGGELEFSFTRTAGRFQNTLSGGYVFLYPLETDQGSGGNKSEYLKYRRMHSFKMNLGSLYKNFTGGLYVDISSRLLNIDDVFLHSDTRERILPGFYDYWNSSSGGHITADPYIGYSLSEKLNISFAVKNILNTEYMGRPGDVMPHRNFSLRLSGVF